MRPVRAWLLRLWGVFRANRDGQFAEEIGAHLEMHVRDLIESVMSPDEARRQAIMKLGGVESTRQAYRDAEQLPWVENLLRDSRHCVVNELTLCQAYWTTLPCNPRWPCMRKTLTPTFLS